MKKAKFLILALLTSLCLNAQSQPDRQEGLDSLFAVWKDKNEVDSNRLEAIDFLARKVYSTGNPDSGILLAQQQFDFAKNRGLKPQMAKALGTQGLSYYYKGEYSNAITFLDKSLSIYKQIENIDGIASTSGNIGLMYKMLGNYSKALEYYLVGLSMDEQIGDELGIAINLNNIGSVYRTLGEYALSIDYHQRSLKIHEKLDNKEGIVYALINLGIVYQDRSNYPKALQCYQRGLTLSEELGNDRLIGAYLSSIGLVYKDQDNPEKSLEYLKRALIISEKNADKPSIAGGLINIGNVYFNQKKYVTALDFFNRGLLLCEEIEHQEFAGNALQAIGSVFAAQGDNAKAEKYYKEALQSKHKIDDQLGAVSVLNSLGGLFLEQKDFTRSIHYCIQSEKLADEIGALEEQKTACLCLYDTYKALDDFEKALKYFEILSSINDTLESQDMGEVLQQMEFDKVMLQDSIAKAEETRLIKEAHREEVRQKNQTLNLLAGGGLLVLILASVVYGRLRFTRKTKAIIEKEKDRSESLLLNILPAEIAEELKANGEAEAQMIDQVTVLFTDFKGFTAMAEQLSPKDLVTDLNLCFSEFDRICEQHGIEKIKTIGDAYMAAGGLPTPNQTHPTDVVKAALEMAEVVKRGKAEKIAANLPFFEVRIGVHTGPVVAGIVGVKKFQYDIWGDTVNTASRMESSGAVGKVNISQATYELLKNDAAFTFESRGKIEAKSKGEIEMYFVSHRSKSGG